MKDNFERRQLPRLRKTLPVKIRTDDFDIVTQTENISGNGAYCKVDKYIAPFTKLNIILLLPLSNKKVTKIQCKGVVVRTEEIKDSKKQQASDFHIAIYFNKISDSDVKKINKYVTSHL